MYLHGSVTNTTATHEVSGFERIVVKLSNDKDFQNQFSIYMDKDGGIEGRQFYPNGRSDQLFKGYLNEDGEFIIFANNKEDERNHAL